MRKASAMVLAAGLCVVAPLQTGCLGYWLAGAHSSRRIESVTTRPAEEDAYMTCGNTTCASVRLEREITQERSGWLFLGPFVLELAPIGVGTALIGSNADLGALLVLGGLTFVLSDFLGIVTYRDEFVEHYGPYKLSDTLFAKWNGGFYSLTPEDLAVDGRIGPTFSLHRVTERRSISTAPTGTAHPQRKHLQIPPQSKLAVLDFKSFSKDVLPENVRYLTDVVRVAILKEAPELEVLTRENLHLLLTASGKDLSQCEGECEVDTGRRIGADAVVSGEIQRFGSSYKLSLRVHETHEGRLLSAAVASGRTLDELDESATNATAELLAREQ